MCGIFGYFNFKDIKLSTKERQRVLSEFIKTQHRGPEHTVFKNVTNNFILGFHRLRIVDVMNGAQPFNNDEETLFCI